jgi:gentisate 1,2-dioxygenase
MNMSTSGENPRLEALHRRLADNSLSGHWQERQRCPDMKAQLWHWPVIYSCLQEAGEVVELGAADSAAARRTVQLMNPGLTAQKATSRTPQMSVQLVKPGEVAEAHRHTAAALRFVVESSGAYTTVNGEQMIMEPGDLVLIPNWTWHDHANSSTDQAIWLDVLDIHLTGHQDAMFVEPDEHSEVAWGGEDVITLDQEDPEIHREYEEELKKNGVQCNVGHVAKYCTFK